MFSYLCCTQMYINYLIWKQIYFWQSVSRPCFLMAHTLEKRKLWPSMARLLTSWCHKITFNGDNVVFHFADNSTQSADMNTAVLSFSHATDIQTLNLLQFKGVVGDAISLSGIADGSTIAIYDAAGHQQLSMKAQEHLFKSMLLLSKRTLPAEGGQTGH